MGYNSYVAGGANITPPIDEKHWPDPDDGDGSVYFGYFLFNQVDGNETVGVVNGQVTVIGTGPGHTHVEFAWDDSSKMYDLDEKMQNLFDWARSHGSKIVGQFDREGEENGDLQRFRFTGDQLHNESPKVIWPGDVGY